MRSHHLLPVLSILGLGILAPSGLRAETSIGNSAMRRAVNNIVTGLRQGTIKPVTNLRHSGLMIAAPQSSGSCSVRLTELTPEGGSIVPVRPIVPPGTGMAKMPVLQVPSPPCDPAAR